MGMPAKLKDFNLFNDAQSYVGLIPELTPPKLTRQMEKYRAGGMTGPVKADFGNDEIVLEWTAGGLIVNALKQYGNKSHSGVQLRFAGAYENDDTGEVDACEIVVRGRHEEIDMGSAKPAEDTKHKFKTTCSYYKLTVNGEVIIELDFMNGVENIGGVDRNAKIRKAIGL